jgi:flavin reductase (DIM6/NTAB) family NADH-FMN oxidoreductase RutF
MSKENSFVEISPYELTDNPFNIIGNDWFLITAGTKEHVNTMTGGWGMMGILWRKAVVSIYIRPTRFTYEFTEKYPFFTLCFFDKAYKDVLSYCGSYSGRDTDKVSECNLTPLITENGSVYFDEARLVFECKKLYFSDLNPVRFEDNGIKDLYPLEDYHRYYTAEILKCLIKK